MIVIIDFGSQTAHLIGRRLRQLGVAYEYVEPDLAESVVTEKKPKGIILSGGPMSVYEPGAPTVAATFFTKRQDIPLLGICYGWQLMAHCLGGEVKSGHKEYGPEVLKLEKATALGVEKRSSQVFMSHGDTVVALPEGFVAVGSTPKVENAMVEHKNGKWFGVQFHPEVQHTDQGMAILKHFASEICHEELAPFEIKPQDLIDAVKKEVGDTRAVIGAVSGGVDSTVAAALIARACGPRFIPVYIESGLMRQGTREWVEEIFTKQIKSNLVVIDARERFMKALKGVTDPEVKRKAIGKLYVDLFQEESARHPEAAYLMQGTIYSDVIESKGSKHASHIKSHHNVGGLPKEMKLKLIEPVRHLYKDEVRELGRILELPEELVVQQPFPGPGYAIRVREEVTPERLEQVKQADDIVVEEIKAAGLYAQVFQCFAVMTGAYSTAVKGDGRVFAEVVALRAYESQDVMTSQWAHLPYQVLQRISSRIVNEVPKVSRVVYDITTKPPATMEWE